MNTIQTNYLELKGTVEDLIEKVGDNLTNDELYILQDVAYDKRELDILREVEVLTYGIVHLEAFKRALALASQRTRATSIEIEEAGHNFHVHIGPTRAGFMADLFVFFGREMFAPRG